MDALETERLVIRNFKPGDWEALLEMIMQYEFSEFAKYDQQWPTNPDDIKGVTVWFAGGDSFLAVCLKDTERLIGFVGLNPEEKEGYREFNIGYVFNSDFHGKGYATESCRAVLGRVFDQLQADQVITGTAAVNLPSCHLLEKLGFKKIAENRGSFRNTTEGTPIEFLGYTYLITREAWKSTGKHE